MGALVWREPGDVGAEQPDLPGIRPHVAGDLVEQGGLAGAVGTDDEAAFPRPDRERYVLGHREAAERLLQVDDFERVIGCRRGHCNAPRFRPASLRRPGMIPVGMTRTMNRKT